MKPTRTLKDHCGAMVDLGVVLMIGIAFVGLMLVAYIIWTLYDQLLLDAPTTASTSAYNDSYWAENSTRASLENITGGFDGAVGLILIAITIMILAIAISALLMLRGRS